MLLYCDSFATYPSLSQRWDVVQGGNVSVSATAARFDAAGLLIVANAVSVQNVQKNLGKNAATLFAGFAVNVRGNDGSPVKMCAFHDVGSSQVALFMNADGTVTAKRADSTTLGSSTAAMSFSTWHYLEFGATIHPSAGTVTVRLDGTAILTLTGLNTQNTGNAYANRFYLGAENGSVSWTVWCDDVYVCDSTGTANYTFLGEIKVAGSAPTGDGTASAYAQNVGARTPSTSYALGTTVLDSNSKLQRVTAAGTSGAGTPTWNTTTGGTTTDGTVAWTNLGAQAAYKLVNEATADEDFSYLSDATVGDQARFTFPTVLGGSVPGVMLFGRARKDDVSTRAIRFVVKSGAAVGDNGTDLGLTTVYQNFLVAFETDPATSAAWTMSAVNAAEFGVKTSV